MDTRFLLSAENVLKLNKDDGHSAVNILNVTE